MVHCGACLADAMRVGGMILFNEKWVETHMETPDEKHYTTTHDDWTDFTTSLKKWWEAKSYFDLQQGPVVVLVILAGIAAYWGVGEMRGLETKRMNEAYVALDLATSPGGKVDVAATYASMPGLVSNAYLDAAQMYLDEVLYGAAGTAGVREALPEEDQAKNLEQSAKYFGQVITLKHTTLDVINGRLGLASVLESQGKFDEARKEYDQVVELAGAKYANRGRMAESRLSDLDRIAKKVTFPAAPVVETPIKDFAAEAAALGVDLPGFNLTPAAPVSPLLGTPEETTTPEEATPEESTPEKTPEGEKPE